MSRLPVVAVVGRPNVGKSTLVNRILRSRSAVVEELPGVTRDRREFSADWAGRDFILVDTGGWEVKPGDDLGRSVREAAEAAVTGADAVVMVVDAQAEISDDDAGVISVLRSAGVPVTLAANKVDHAGAEWDVDRLWRLGLGEPFPVSAYHGRGVGELLDGIVAVLPEADIEQAESLSSVAIVGRPNVGKSTLLNRLAGTDRVIVSQAPGTTRDPIDVEVTIGEDRYRLVDTAGIRRRPQIHEDADYFSVLRARQAIESADVALLMVDATEGVTHQDQRIASELVDSGAAVVILLNKWDAAGEEERELTERSLPDRFGFMGWAPVLRVSAKTGAGLKRLAPVLAEVRERRQTRVPTGLINRQVREWIASHPPPVRKGRRPKIHYVVQAGTAPPTFVLFLSGGELGDDYLRYLENRLRQVHDFTGNPIRFSTRKRRR